MLNEREDCLHHGDDGHRTALRERAYLAIDREWKGQVALQILAEDGKEEFNSHAVSKIIASLMKKFGEGMVASCFFEQSFRNDVEMWRFIEVSH